MSTNDIQNGLTPIADNCDQLRTKSGQDDPESSPGLTFGEAWDIQNSVGPSLAHDPKCSSVPGHHPLSGPALLCDCGAIVREWNRRRSTPPTSEPVEVASPTPEKDAQSVRPWMDLQNMTTFARSLERQLAEAREQRDRLAEALRNLKAEYDDRKNQFGDSPLWAKHEDVDVIKDCHAMIAAVEAVQMSNQPTPETDKNFPTLRNSPDTTCAWVTLGTLRDLEREREEAREQRDTLASAIRQFFTELEHAGLDDCIEGLGDDLFDSLACLRPPRPPFPDNQTVTEGPV